jgi:hypothetical protein
LGWLECGVFWEEEGYNVIYNNEDIGWGIPPACIVAVAIFFVRMNLM